MSEFAFWVLTFVLGMCLCAAIFVLCEMTKEDDWK
jgi:hypothetical protein